MSEPKNLISQFHSGHRQVIDALTRLHQAILARDLGGVRNILSAAEGLVGPRFGFEEIYLYPALEPFFGEADGKRLLNEHDGVFRSIRKIAELAQKGSWTDAEPASALANLDLLYEHPIGCDGLNLWTERLPAKEQEDLFQKMLAVREQGTTLSDYYRERQAA